MNGAKTKSVTIKLSIPTQIDLPSSDSSHAWKRHGVPQKRQEAPEGAWGIGMGEGGSSTPLHTARRSKVKGTFSLKGLRTCARALAHDAQHLKGFVLDNSIHKYAQGARKLINRYNAYISIMRYLRILQPAKKKSDIFLEKCVCTLKRTPPKTSILHTRNT